MQFDLLPVALGIGLPQAIVELEVVHIGIAAGGQRCAHVGFAELEVVWSP